MSRLSRSPPLQSLDNTAWNELLNTHKRILLFVPRVCKDQRAKCKAASALYSQGEAHAVNKMLLSILLIIIILHKILIAFSASFLITAYSVLLKHIKYCLSKTDMKHVWYVKYITTVFLILCPKADIWPLQFFDAARINAWMYLYITSL